MLVSDAQFEQTTVTVSACYFSNCIIALKNVSYLFGSGEQVKRYLSLRLGSFLRDTKDI